MNNKWKVAQEHELKSWMDTSMDHNRLLKIWEEKLSQIEFIAQKIDKNTKILDIGCGPVPILHVLPKTELMVAADPLSGEYKKKFPRKSYIKYKNFAAEEIPYRDLTFDIVFCINALDHMADPQKSLNEMSRVLNRGGLLYFEYENSSPLIKFLAKLGYKKHLADYHPHLISTGEVLNILRSTTQNLEVVRTSSRPQFTFEKITYFFGLLFRRKNMTDYDRSVSSLSQSKFGFITHNLIIFVERVLYFFAPQSFSYFSTMVIRKG